MQAKDGLRFHGAVTLEIKRENGEIQTLHKDNLIVDAGFDFIADAIANPVRPDAMAYIALGTDNTAAAAGQTALLGEIARKAATYDHTAGTKTFTLSATFDPGEATGALVEAGCLNAAAAGTLLDRVTFLVQNKGAGDTITVTFTFTLS